MSFPFRVLYERLLRPNPGYDPVFDTIVQNEQMMYEAGKTVVETAKKYPGEIASAGVFVASRMSPLLGASMIVYDIYRLVQYIEEKYPGKLHEEFRYQLSAATDANRYWSGDYDFEKYSVKGDSWKRYHEQKTTRGRPKKPVYVRDFV